MSNWILLFIKSNKATNSVQNIYQLDEALAEKDLSQIKMGVAIAYMDSEHLFNFPSHKEYLY